MEFKLIVKKLQNTLTPKETFIFSRWYEASEAHKSYFDNVKANFENDVMHIDVKAGWLRIENKLRVSKRKKNQRKYVAAASVLFFVALSIIFNNDTIETSDVLVISDAIKTGTDKALLTLEDGSTVTLQKGRKYQTHNLTSNGKALVYSSKNSSEDKIAYNYLTTPRGGQFQVTLEDGTRLWLNSDSKIKYPKQFTKGSPREIELVYGEAYFEVSPSSGHNGSSFKVISNQHEVEVLGTEFNLRAYKDEPNIYTTLIEGKVVVRNGVTFETLKPNEQTAVNVQNSTISMAIVDVYNVISWRNGIFSFKEKPLDEIMKTLSRWYDIDIIFKNPIVEKMKFNGVLSKNQKLETILSIIKATNNIDYEIKKSHITIK
jgi:ferric-dicitrate binding protein FerR (iron transport regulator)